MDSSILENLGEDLVLLSIRPDKGSLAVGDLDLGLMASELVRLAVRARIDIQDDHVVVLDKTPVGDPELDSALNDLVQAKRPPGPANWMRGRRGDVTRGYLARLVGSGALREEPRRFGGPRWLIADPARAAAARARLDAIALSPGQVDVAQAAFGGLAHAISLDWFLYPGRASKPARERLEQISKGQWTAESIGAAADSATSQSSIRAVVQAVTKDVVYAARARKPVDL